MLVYAPGTPTFMCISMDVYSIYLYEFKNNNRHTTDATYLMVYLRQTSANHKHNIGTAWLARCADVVALGNVYIPCFSGS